MGYIAFIAPLVVALVGIVRYFIFHISGLHFLYLFIVISIVAIIISILTIHYHWKGYVFAWISIGGYGLIVLIFMIFCILLFFNAGNIGGSIMPR